MKTRTWVILFAILAVVCLAAVLFPIGREKGTACVYSDGVAVLRLDLSQDGEYLVEYGSEWNILRVSGGKISVASASCASQDCVKHAPADGGAPIVCLPNRLVIEFTDAEEFDAFLQ